VPVEWKSGLGRLEREVACMRFLAEILPVGQVPQVVHHDAEHHVVLMTAAPTTAVSWKGLLMGGHFDPETATAVGTMLRTMHEESVRKEAYIRPSFDDITYFEELRIDPFHRYLQQQYPGLTADIEQLIGQVSANRTCLTHGDYSPKNFLIADNGGLILLDFEVAHWGNPVFDLAYCIGHLMLKGWVLHKEPEAVELIARFLDAYGRQTDPLIPHLGLMLLARLDGKSTVDYVTDDMMRARIRSIAQSWIGWTLDAEPIPFIEAALGVDDLI
jgi:Ser/Thr protein kinase RdoA (MazF antagonist)